MVVYARVLVGTYEYHEVAFRVFVSMLDQHYHTFHVFRGYLRKVLLNFSAASLPNACFLLVAPHL